MPRFHSLSCVMLLVATLAFPTMAQSDAPDSPPKHSVGGSMFMLFNLLPFERPPEFFQLNYAYRITPKDVVSLEAISWRFDRPLGIQYWQEEQAMNYPGSVKSYGVGVAYQRFLWKGAYAAIHMLPLLQRYRNPDKDFLQRGFQLFMTARAGYHFRFGEERFFLEPSMAITSWPITTNMPAAFKEVEKDWGKVFLFEPGLHAGVLF